MKINLREELNKLDAQTYCKYDMLNIYESMSMTEDEKKELVKMIANGEDADTIGAFMNKKYRERECGVSDDVDESLKENNDSHSIVDKVNALRKKYPKAVWFDNGKEIIVRETRANENRLKEFGLLDYALFDTYNDKDIYVIDYSVPYQTLSANVRKNESLEEHEEESFVVTGYDKDNDVYEDLKLFDNIDDAKRFASIVEEEIKNEEIVSESGEPFDWLVIDKYVGEKFVGYYVFYDGDIKGNIRKVSGDKNESLFDLEEGEWVELESKQVPDSSGFYTDYTWYTDGKKHIFMFGDKDIYTPNADYADWEVEIYPGKEGLAYKEAEEWFNSYNGFDGSDWDGSFDDFHVDDYVDESLDDDNSLSELIDSAVDFYVSNFRNSNVKDYFGKQAISELRNNLHIKFYVDDYIKDWERELQNTAETDEEYLDDVQSYIDLLKKISDKLNSNESLNDTDGDCLRDKKFDESLNEDKRKATFEEILEYISDDGNVTKYRTHDGRLAYRVYAPLNWYLMVCRKFGLQPKQVEDFVYEAKGDGFTFEWVEEDAILAKDNNDKPIKEAKDPYLEPFEPTRKDGFKSSKEKYAHQLAKNIFGLLSRDPQQDDGSFDYVIEYILGIDHQRFMGKAPYEELSQEEIDNIYDSRYALEKYLLRYDASTLARYGIDIERILLNKFHRDDRMIIEEKDTESSREKRRNKISGKFNVPYTLTLKNQYNYTVIQYRIDPKNKTIEKGLFNWGDGKGSFFKNRKELQRHIDDLLAQGYKMVENKDESMAKDLKRASKQLKDRK